MEIKKQANLVTKGDLKTVSLFRCATENEEKIEKRKRFELNFFLDKNFFCDDGLQSIFVYQKTLVRVTRRQEY